MKVEIKLFAVAKQLAGAEAISIELPAGATVQDLREAIGDQHPVLRDITTRAMIAIDTEYVSDDALVPENTVPENTVPENTVPENTVPENTVPENSEIALIPPVSGG